MLGETPWVDRAMTKAWERISHAAPRQAWMPRHTIKKNESVRVSELGCGHYGCVMVTADPMVVCKLTSDPTEAAFIAAALSLGEIPDGVVKYHAVYSIPGMTHNRRPVFVLWRETALKVGFTDIRAEQVPSKHPSTWEYERAALEQLLRFLNSFKEVAAIVRQLLKEGNPVAVLEEAKRLDDWAWDQVAELDLETARSPWVGARPPSRAHRVALGLRFCRALAETMENTYLCDGIGGAFSFYLEHDLLLADVHGNNIGLVERMGKIPVITDPGHAVSLSPRWRQVSIPELP